MGETPTPEPMGETPTPEPMGETPTGGRPNLLAGQRLPPPARQERSRRKREALLSAALALFAEHGYEETSIEEIARRAGVAVGGFYQHFASKRQVLLVLMNGLLDEASALVPPLDGTLPASSPRDAIESLVRQGLRVDWAYAGAYRAWREAAVRDAEVRALYHAVEDWTAGQLEQIVHVLLRAPGARHDVAVAPLSWVLGLLFWRLAETPLDDADAVVASVTDLIYHALYYDR